MTDNISIEKYTDYRYTSDYVFVIKPLKNASPQNESPFLYIRKEEHEQIKNNPSADYETLNNFINHHFIILDTEQPEEIELSSSTRTTKGVKFFYYKYKFFRKLIDERQYEKNDHNKLVLSDKDRDNPLKKNENDCLKFGECMTVANQKIDHERFKKMIGVTDTEDKGTVPILQLQGTENIFGDTQTKNRKLAKNFPKDKKDNKANPAIGQSYAIVNHDNYKYYPETDEKVGATPYHIAFVIAKHKNFNITIEAFAEEGPEYDIKFGFYDTENLKYTFHNYFSNKYFNNANTIVLESRNIDTILNIIDEEIIEKEKRIANIAAKKRNASMISEVIPVNIPEPFVPSNETRKRTRKLSASRNKSVVKSTPSLKKKSISATSMNRNNTRKKTKFF
jgi:hypothetical protein